MRPMDGDPIASPRGAVRLVGVLLVVEAVFIACLLAQRTSVELTPRGTAFGLLRGVAPNGQLAGRARLILPGFERDAPVMLRLRVQPRGARSVSLQVRVDGALALRETVTGLQEFAVDLPRSRVNALRLDLSASGGSLRVQALEFEARSERIGPRPVLASILAALLWYVARRARAPAPLALASWTAALAVLASTLPLALVAWPASARGLSPALALLAGSLALGLWRGGRRFLRDAALVTALVLGATLRLLFLPTSGSFDTEYWKGRMHHTRDAGWTQAYGPPGATAPGHALKQLRGEEEAWQLEWEGRRYVVDYPPLSMAAWAAGGWLMDRAAPDWPARERDNAAVKLPALFGDLLALVLLPWLRRPRWRRGLELAALYWVLPVSWLSSGVLGYFDGILPPLLLLALAAAASGRSALAGALLALVALLKPTALIAAPAAVLALWQARGRLRRATLAGLALGALVFLPFALAGTLATAVVHCLQLLHQETLSGGYPNVWWLLGHALTFQEGHGARGPVAFAPVALLRPFPVRLVGTLLFAACAAFVLRRQGGGARAAFRAAALLFMAYSMFGIGVHENHPHPIFLLLLAAGLPTRRERAVFAALATVYVCDMLALSGFGRFYGLRELWLLPLASAAGRLRMALGIDLTLWLALLHGAAFAAALYGLRRDPAGGSGGAGPARGDRLHDRLAVEAAGLDEDPAGLAARRDRAAHEQAAHVRLEGVGIVARLERRGIDLDPGADEQGRVGVIAGQQEHGARGQLFAAAGALDRHRVGADREQARLEQAADRAVLDAVLDVGTNPVLDRVGEGGAAVHEADAGAGPAQLERRDRRGVLAAHHHDVLPVVGVGLVVVVEDVGQRFAGNAEAVGVVVVARADRDVAGLEELAPVPRVDPHRERVAAAREGCDRAAQAQFQAERVRDTPVVAQRLPLRRLLVGRHERQAADLEQLRGREERHGAREVEDRVDQHALLEDLVVEARLLRRDRGGQARGAGADHQQVLHGSSRVTPGISRMKSAP